MLVLTNQVAYWVVTRLSTLTGQHAVEQGVAGGVGYTAYSYAYQLWVVPQGIVTVSLVTALMPRMSRAAAEEISPGCVAMSPTRCVRRPRWWCPHRVRCSRSRRG